MIRTLDGNNVTVVNFRPVKDSPVADWYSELLVANAHATHFREMIAKRLTHVKRTVPITAFEIDSVVTYYKLNYTLWKEEVERLNALIQSYHIAQEYVPSDD